MGAAIKHLLGSLAVGTVCAALVFGLWYPYPYGELVGGRELFLLLISVDVICGPLLTFVVFDPRKLRRELWRDIGIIVFLQGVALAYGIATVIQARPVYLAFEGDRFRVVSVPDVEFSEINRAPESLRNLSLTGPRMLGVHLVKSGDPDYLQSIKAALGGLHPAFRPSRWVEYEQQHQTVRDNARSLAQLKGKNPNEQRLINETILKTNLNEQQLGYLPLAAGNHTDWVVIIGLEDAQPKAYLPLDGWLN